MNPLIGITLDSEEAGGYSKSPWYALRKNYCEAVRTAGGVPILLPHHADCVDRYLALIQGLIVSGGAFDVDPALFGAAERHEAVVLKPGRTTFELALVRGALERDMPVLGICGGEQLVNVALGGSLIQHIPHAVAGGLEHEQTAPRHLPGHEVALTPGSKLAAIAGCAAIPVNSSHHQAIREVGAGCIVNAIAPDGVIEGIEMPGKRFCLGVQWHPEYNVSPADAALFRAFIEACR
ncbi:gamma-glutamyl-gamma-aminobutyrate hydrolase [Paramagnetospirillum kuznetsovii]|uniref:Gamma-glutamyl-gamma-aminobutyrate hydrolase n=1 Tax=Paramagnetospirillum kuznetsovii TaxID=2053833 RepID=A0A364P0N8_9PROT|nr:gamma-glutamyl-gamma-aminobutyrate hydrolase family protein [Paramagnetospirillum kuznetsovii]RAU22866.1 gamma-glutamyl-gamma-aminobutyrate hydrolase [Paramagnetospirillum kuznetsovii]